MSTSDSAATGGWLRKGIVGLALALVVISIHLVVGLGPWWPALTAAAFAGGALVTPQPQSPGGRSAAVEDPRQRQLSRASYRNCRDVPAEAPAMLRSDLYELDRSVQALLGDWDDLAAVPEQRLTVEEIVLEHVPAVLACYRDVPDPRHPQAVRDALDSVQILRSEIDKMRAAVLQDSLTELGSRTEALRLRFGQLPCPAPETDHGPETGGAPQP